MSNEPSMDEWLKEAKADPRAAECGMFLVHNGVVRATAKAQVRAGEQGLPPVTQVAFSHDPEKVKAAMQAAGNMEGIQMVKVWLNDGVCNVGDSLMYVLVGGDIRPHVIDCLQELVGTIKNECVVESEIFA